MNKPRRTRNVHEWYTTVNVYCLFRLWKMQEEKGIVVEHKDLDKFQRKFLKEVGLTPKKKFLMSQKFAHDDGVVLYNSSEDFNLLCHLRDMEMYGGPLDNLELAYCAQDAAYEIETMGFATDSYASFEEMRMDITETIKSEMLSDGLSEDSEEVRKNERLCCA